MLSPKRVKHRKTFRGRMKGKASRGNFVAYGDYGLQSLDARWVTANQIEAARIAMTRYIRRGGKVWIKIFPDKPVTKKPAEVRMGSGKGSPEYWVAVVKPGRVMFELAGVAEDVAREAMRLAANKLPVRCKFIKRDSLVEGEVSIYASNIPYFEEEPPKAKEPEAGAASEGDNAAKEAGTKAETAGEPSES
jgi:large subunit ribosomal protein L16